MSGADRRDSKKNSGGRTQEDTLQKIYEKLRASGGHATMKMSHQLWYSSNYGVCNCLFIGSVTSSWRSIVSFDDVITFVGVFVPQLRKLVTDLPNVWKAAECQRVGLPYKCVGDCTGILVYSMRMDGTVYAP